MADTPCIVLLTAADEDRLPGLDGIESEAELIHVREEDELRERLPQADILLVTDFRTDMLERAWPDEHHISWVHATSAGVDALMFPALVNSDLVVTNARGIFNRGIAEYVLGAVLLMAKDSINNLRYQRQHQWCHRETELIRNKTALIVGAGSIGQDVAALLGAAGMHVIGTARSEREDENFADVHASDRLYDLLPDADYIILTAPLTEETRGMIDREALDCMQPTARLINVARGEIVDQDALIEALQQEWIAGAVLDVFENEPLEEDSPLWNMPQVMISAHMAGDFTGWKQALGEQFVDNFRRWRKGKTLHNLVDKNKGYAGSG